MSVLPIMARHMDVQEVCDNGECDTLWRRLLLAEPNCVIKLGRGSAVGPSDREGMYEPFVVEVELNGETGVCEGRNSAEEGGVGRYDCNIGATVVCLEP